MSFCLDTYLQQSDDYDILKSRATFQDCAKIINEKSEEVWHVNPGETVLGARIIGIPPIPIGVNPKKHTIIISYTKPCHGTAAIEIPVTDKDIEEIWNVVNENTRKGN